MKLLIEVDVADKIASAYENFTPENKQEVNLYISRILQKTANKARIITLRKTVAELQSDPECDLNPEILYLLFQGDED
jgi:hypothetical protein